MPFKKRHKTYCYTGCRDVWKTAQLCIKKAAQYQFFVVVEGSDTTESEVAMREHISKSKERKEQVAKL